MWSLLKHTRVHWQGLVFAYIVNTMTFKNNCFLESLCEQAVVFKNYRVHIGVHWQGLVFRLHIFSLFVFPFLKLVGINISNQRGKTIETPSTLIICMTDIPFWFYDEHRTPWQSNHTSKGISISSSYEHLQMVDRCRQGVLSQVRRSSGGGYFTCTVTDKIIEYSVCSFLLLFTVNSDKTDIL